MTSKRRVKAEWAKSVDDMTGKGMQATDDEQAEITGYLTHFFGKINVNRATAADIADVLELTPKEAAAIVEYREKNGEFKTVESVVSVPGIDAKKAETRRERILLK